ncbi:MAG: tetratricopeptide repeat protein [Planctomycetota bacterium]|jgi:hypothetical protein
MKMISFFILTLVVPSLLITSCITGTIRSEGSDIKDDDIQAISLLGKPLRTSALPKGDRKKLEQQLADAEEVLKNNPGDEDALIWVGRRTAYLGRKKEAIEIYSKGIEKFPQSARLYRHRGHQYIGLRRFQEAIDDLEQASRLITGKEDEIEPDGMPNERNIPTSTLHSNIWYHLGLARYLCGDFSAALDAYEECMKVSRNPDMLAATSNWLYMTLMRLGRDEAAARVLEPIHADMDIIENNSYHELLLLYKGERDPDALLEPGAEAIDNVTMGYGIGNWHFYSGREEQARAIFEGIVESSQWNAFGTIAAEAELSRM